MLYHDRIHANPKLLLVLLLAAGTGCAPAMSSSPQRQPIPPGKAQVARLPDGQGLQYCINLRHRDLAPPGSRFVFVHSLSAYVTTTNGAPALQAIHGRYPGWDTPGTTVYQQQFTNVNVVDLEITHEFPSQGVVCIEVYGSHLAPARYALFNYRILVGYSYLLNGRGRSEVKLFKVRWARYLPHFAPLHRPKH